ncbi:hypothetical protein SAMN05444354_12817 [Stigmatella aurantiaca]|uniref:Uncharacterized protein n=1 Tax=Stigmatella aurantiaca TaxID=41 RepID=A0A1H8D175_STIAU|nr:hypothetical protein [Stigmatella aurantiaca]SEN00434.1 hypothetical protein SAMN05444354_12817 [Stigmatella aurantiaca]
MKIQDPAPAGPEKAPASGLFQRLLPPAKPPQAPGVPPSGPARPPLPATRAPGVSQPPALQALPRPGTALAASPARALVRSALASPENLGHARQGMHGEAQRLRTVRTEAQASSQAQVEHRVHELLSRELARDLPPASGVSPPPRAPAPPPEPAGEAPSGEHPSRAEGLARPPGEAAVEAAEAPSQVQATLELIERIEVFVKSQRPALRMSLGGALAATVEVERTGPREVALRIQGHQGPLGEAHLSRIREALEARGLRLRALHAH